MKDKQSKKIQSKSKKPSDSDRSVMNPWEFPPNPNRPQKTIDEKYISIKEDYLEEIQKEKPNLNRIQSLITQAILDTEHIKSLRHDNTTSIRIFKDGVWTDHGATYIREILFYIYGTALKETTVKNVLKVIETARFKDGQEFDEEPTPYLINVLNGIVDIRTGKLMPHSPEHNFTWKFNVAFNPSADCPKYRHMISETLFHEEAVKFFQEFAGYTLERTHRFKDGLIFVGETHSGKTRLLIPLSELHGHSRTSFKNLNDFKDDNFSVSELYKKNLNIGGEVSPEYISDPTVMKMLLGNDRINAKVKYKGDMPFTSYAKQIHNANQLPPMNDDSRAMLYRWNIIECPFQFMVNGSLDEDKMFDAKKYMRIIDPDKEQTKKKRKEYLKTHNQKKANPDIEQGIINDPMEMSGVLNYLIEGYQRLHKNNGFSKLSTHEDRFKTWMKSSDSFMYFLMNCLQADRTQKIKIDKSHLRLVYWEFCKREGKKPRGDQAIKNALEQNFPVNEERETSRDSARRRYWVGVNFKTKDDGTYIDFFKKELGIDITLESGTNWLSVQGLPEVIKEEKVKEIETPLSDFESTDLLEPDPTTSDHAKIILGIKSYLEANKDNQMKGGYPLDKMKSHTKSVVERHHDMAFMTDEMFFDVIERLKEKGEISEHKSGKIQFVNGW